LFSAAISFAADPGLMKLVMPDARVVSGINVAHIKTTPFGQFALAQFSASQDPQFDRFVKASGFDPSTNLEQIVVASEATGHRLVIARGTFDPARIADLARGAGAEVTQYQGVEMISPPAAPSAHGVSMSSAAFLSGSIALAGDTDSVRAAIDRRSTGGGPSPDIAARVDTVSASSDAWFVSTVPVAELAQGVPEPNLRGALKGDVLKSVQQMSGGATFGQAVRFSAEMVTGSAEDASSLSDVLRFLAGFAGMGQQNGRRSDLAPLLSALDVKIEGNVLKLALSVPESQIESLIRQAGK
jgi:hypothetical protein